MSSKKRAAEGVAALLAADVYEPIHPKRPHLRKQAPTVLS